jgi:hypothetical protein
VSKKILLCDGDSWTAGDMIDPKLTYTIDVNHVDNDDYRLSKVWPYDLEKLTNIKVINNSRAGSSNDGIVRRVIDNISYLTEKNKSEDLFVIVGFSSPERKDFYYKGELDGELINGWETLYPAELNSDVWKYNGSPLADFYKLYVSYFWNTEEYISRYIGQILFLHYFLKGNNIKHKFFNSFYEDWPGEESPFQQAVSGIGKGMFNENDLMDDLTSHHTIHKSTIQKFSKIYKDIFIEESFRNYLSGLSKTNQEFDPIYFERDGFHPNRKGHQLWSKVVFKNIKDML